MNGCLSWTFCSLSKVPLYTYLIQKRTKNGHFWVFWEMNILQNFVNKIYFVTRSMKPFWSVLSQLQVETIKHKIDIKCLSSRTVYSCKVATINAISWKDKFVYLKVARESWKGYIDVCKYRSLKQIKDYYQGIPMVCRNKFVYLGSKRRLKRGHLRL